METKQSLKRNDENHDENNYTHQPIKKPPRSPKSSVNKGASKYGDKWRRKSSEAKPNSNNTPPPGQPEKIIKNKNITNSHEGDRRLADEATKLITVQEKIKTIKVLKL